MIFAISFTDQKIINESSLQHWVAFILLNLRRKNHEIKNTRLCKRLIFTETNIEKKNNGRNELRASV